MKKSKKRCLSAVLLVACLMPACGHQSSAPLVAPESEPAPIVSAHPEHSQEARSKQGTAPPAAPEQEEPPVRSIEAMRAAPSPPLPGGTKVLHVGDSFAGALGLPLGAIFEQAGVRSVLKHTDASYLTDWAWDGNLQKYIWKYNPDLIIVTLGANELEIVQPELREKTIKKIIATIGDIPCVWVAIPLWEGPKNGLLDVIERNAAPCAYMNTNELIDVRSMPRIHDGIHPTAKAREAWAADVALWLREARKPTAERPWNLR